MVLRVSYPSGMTVDWERDDHGNLRAVEFDTTRQAFVPPVNTRMLGEAYGLEVFDTAIPQQWADEVERVTGIYPFGFVWCYDPIFVDGKKASSLWGFPFPVTPGAQGLYAVLPEYLR